MEEPQEGALNFSAALRSTLRDDEDASIGFGFELRVTPVRTGFELRLAVSATVEACLGWLTFKLKLLPLAPCVEQLLLNGEQVVKAGETKRWTSGGICQEERMSSRGRWLMEMKASLAHR